MSTAADRAGRTPVELVAEAVRACPAVADLHGGAFGVIATHLPGRRVTGVLANGDPAEPASSTLIEIHVSGYYPRPVSEIARQVRAAARSAVPDCDIVVTVEDYF